LRNQQWPQPETNRNKVVARLCATAGLAATAATMMFISILQSQAASSCRVTVLYRPA
jgi:hypothetical protein